MAYYVRMASWGSGGNASPRQALSYITDGHDARRDTKCSEHELRYIARMDAGWKADVDSGRVLLVGYGELAGEPDQERLARRFESSCQPTHHALATIGCKTLMLTIPKEVSLYAEGHRQEAKAALSSATATALERMLRGLSYAAVAGIHTRNSFGEIHYHAHVLVGKFARHIASGCTVTLNNSIGLRAMREMRLAWHEAVEREFRQRLQLGIEEQRRRGGAVALVLPDGSRLEPLDHDSQLLCERQLRPTFTEITKSGATVVRRLHLGTVDDRIFETACAARGTAGWSLIAFTESFPELGDSLLRYQARALALRSIGYLSPDGQITSDFRVHFSLRHGTAAPEFQGIRLDLLCRLDREQPGAAATLQPSELWRRAQGYPDLRRRIERLGYSAAEAEKSFARALAQRPSRETLQPIQAARAREEAAPVAPVGQPQATIIRAYLERRESKIQRIYLLAPGVTGTRPPGARLAFGAGLKRAAERDLALARNHRLARLGLALRPVIWLARLPMPWDPHQLDLAITRCGQLARQQQIHRAGRAEIQKAYDLWQAEPKEGVSGQRAHPTATRLAAVNEEPRRSQLDGRVGSRRQGRVDDRLADQLTDRLRHSGKDQGKDQPDEPTR